MSDVTCILSAATAGDPRAASDPLPLVYEELRKLAPARLASEKPRQALQATAQVHEAYLRLVGDGKPRDWNGRGHFLAAAAEAMRRILVDNARRKKCVKHGGAFRRVDCLDGEVSGPADDEQILLLDEALTRLAAVRPRAAELIQLRFYSGLQVEEASPPPGLSPRTTRRQWAFARAWLRREMERVADPPT